MDFLKFEYIMLAFGFAAIGIVLREMYLRKKENEKDDSTELYKRWQGIDD